MAAIKKGGRARSSPRLERRRGSWSSRGGNKESRTGLALAPAAQVQKMTELGKQEAFSRVAATDAPRSRELRMKL